MSTRDEILARVRRNQPAARPLPELPLFDQSGTSAAKDFAAGLAGMGGSLVAPKPHQDLDALVRTLHSDARVICSATPEVAGNRALDRRASAAALDDVDVGVVRARFGVAETGSVWLSEAEFGVSALGFLSQHLVVLLDPEDIVPNLHHAYRRPEFRAARYAALMTGPSATADIEGVLIRGAQGIRSLTVILVPRPERAPV
jgi:L-lactate dehydrogenase complex protein LldG